MSDLKITTTLRRSRSGLALTVYGTPLIEESIKALGNGSTRPLELFGRHWRWESRFSESALSVYHLSENSGMGGVQGPPGQQYRLDQPGQPLIDNNYDYPVTNLSFLRLVGISQGDGITIALDGVHSLDGIKSMNESIKKSCREFCVNFLKPVNMSTTIFVHDSPTEERVVNDVYRE